MPILVEVVPPSCIWRGGMAVSLFVNNLPQDGPIYVSFGGTIVDTVGVQYGSLRSTHRSKSVSEDPRCADMQGPTRAMPM